MISSFLWPSVEGGKEGKEEGRQREERFGTSSIKFSSETPLQLDYYQLPAPRSLPHTLCLSCVAFQTFELLCLHQPPVRCPLSLPLSLPLLSPFFDTALLHPPLSPSHCYLDVFPQLCDASMFVNGLLSVNSQALERGPRCSGLLRYVQTALTNFEPELHTVKIL